MNTGIGYRVWGVVKTKETRYKSLLVSILMAIVLVTTIASCSATQTGSNNRGDLVIGAKAFTEQDILGELLAQQIEAKTGLKVTRRLQLGDTLVCHNALLSGQIDLYPEYTGTAFSTILKQKTIGDVKEVYRQVKDDYAQQFKLAVMPPLGFQNTFAMIVRGDMARSLNLKTLSQSSQYIPQWQAGFGYEFTERQEYANMVKTYDFKFTKAPRLLNLGLLYRALLQKQVDLVAGNSTDGQITRSDFVILEDDRHAFPPYEAAAIVREATLQKYPKVREALEQLAGKISPDEMQHLNYLVDGELRDLKDVVRSFRQSKNL
ncbi:MAG: ABC transporter substrate-binding protein [Lyngbya sp. HA4199-MV5]|jgi:osmoprotectant transport system substrate-binding protein|nr:ABC transporter substrate-binding protein [Lyngbya sp. HA4199-MV5]